MLSFWPPENPSSGNDYAAAAGSNRVPIPDRQLLPRKPLIRFAAGDGLADHAVARMLGRLQTGSQ